MFKKQLMMFKNDLKKHENDDRSTASRMTTGEIFCFAIAGAGALVLLTWWATRSTSFHDTARTPAENESESERAHLAAHPKYSARVPTPRPTAHATGAAG